MTSFWSTFTKRKQIENVDDASELARVLTLFDLVALGVGSTLGLGIYVLAGSVAYDIAGPAVILSFVIAAVASAFAGICYAEFASRVPRAGSAYVYSYVTINELVAFTIGWNLVLEYAIGTSSVARGMSGYFFSLVGVNITEELKDYMLIKTPFLAEYPDFLSGFMILLLTVLLALGAKESSVINNVLTILNLLTISIVIIAGSFHANINNWLIPAKEVPDGFGTGGFMPYSYYGLLEGAARCFFGYVGFDCVATTGEEAINPQRNIPRAIFISLILIFLAYFGISSVLTLMVPYYKINKNAPFLFAFEDVGMVVVKWIVAVGAVFALWAALLGALFPMPRILYAMGCDRVLFKFLGKVNARTHTPVVATFVTGSFSALMAVLFDLEHLIDMMSIGTLMAYTVVAISVLVLRYEDPDMIKPDAPKNRCLRQLYNGNGFKKPNVLSAHIARYTTFLFTLTCVLWCTCSNILKFDSLGGQISLAIITFVLFVLMFVIFMQPVTTIPLAFKVRFVPLTPCVSIFVNLFLMSQLDRFTWIRIMIWLSFGYLIYFSYSIKKYFSSARLHRSTLQRRHLHHLRLNRRQTKQIMRFVVKYVKKLVIINVVTVLSFK